MSKIINGALACASVALFLGYAVAFVTRWGVRGLIVAAIFGGALALGAAAALGRWEGTWPRWTAAIAYVLLAAFALASLQDEFKNDLIRYLLFLQAGAGAIGFIACLLPRRA